MLHFVSPLLKILYNIYMKKSEEYFKIFDTKLKKYATNQVANMFATFDRHYFKLDKTTPIERVFSDGIYSQKIIIQPWFFADIIFYSTKYNDFKSNISEQQAWELYGLYHNYALSLENEYAEENFNNPDDNILSPIVYGHLQEQGIYEVSQLFFINRFNRNYHILKDVQINSKGLEDIVSNAFGIKLKTYIEFLCIIAIVSVSYKNLTCEDILQTIDNTDIYYKILNTMTVNYDDCRKQFNTMINKDIFKIKPLLNTQLNEYIVPSTYLMFYNFSDKLYWLLKDEYKNTGIFVTKFGEVFEDYVYEILVKQFGCQDVERIPKEKNNKSADFKIETDELIMLIEVKAGVARANSKKSNLDKNDFDFFITNNITDAMKQLDASAGKLDNGKQIISVILNYDQILVEDSLLFDIESLYKPKHYKIQNLLLTGIDYFENFIYTFNTTQKLNEFFKENKNNLKTYVLVEKSKIHKNFFYEDIFNLSVEQFVDKLRNLQSQNQTARNQK